MPCIAPTTTGSAKGRDVVNVLRPASIGCNKFMAARETEPSPASTAPPETPASTYSGTSSKTSSSMGSPGGQMKTESGKWLVLELKSLATCCQHGPQQLVSEFFSRLPLRHKVGIDRPRLSRRPNSVRYRRRSSKILRPHQVNVHPSMKYYIDLDPLGEGGFGTIRRASSSESGLQCVVKSIPLDSVPEELLAVRNEMEVHADLDHPNIVRIIETFEDCGELFIVMEECSGGPLLDFITARGSLSEGEVRIIMRQVMGALAYMHTKAFMHRDVKPENFLFKDADVPLPQNLLKLIDFGMADSVKQDVSAELPVCGTPEFMAPEVQTGFYAEKVDVWSAGIMLHLLLSGLLPFVGETNEEVFKQACQGDISFHRREWDTVSSEAKLLVGGMCKLDPGRRFSAQAALDTPWMVRKDVGVDSWHRLTTFSKEQAEDLIENLKRFSKLNRFKKDALHLVAYCLEGHEVAELRRTFTTCDRKGNGAISINELLEALHHSGLPEEEITVLFKNLDADNRGVIDYTEFLSAILSRQKMLERKACREAFRRFDADGDGQISAAELSQAISSRSSFGYELDDEQVGEMWRAADRNGDGSVDFEDFMAMLQSEGTADDEVVEVVEVVEEDEEEVEVEVEEFLDASARKEQFDQRSDAMSPRKPCRKALSVNTLPKGETVSSGMPLRKALSVNTSLRGDLLSPRYTTRLSFNALRGLDSCSPSKRSSQASEGGFDTRSSSKLSLGSLQGELFSPAFRENLTLKSVLRKGGGGGDGRHPSQSQSQSQSLLDPGELVAHAFIEDLHARSPSKRSALRQADPGELMARRVAAKTRSL